MASARRAERGEERGVDGARGVGGVVRGEAGVEDGAGCGRGVAGVQQRGQVGVELRGDGLEEVERGGEANDVAGRARRGARAGRGGRWR